MRLFRALVLPGAAGGSLVALINQPHVFLNLRATPVEVLQILVDYLALFAVVAFTEKFFTGFRSGSRGD